MNLFLEPLRSVRICDDSVRTRADITLAQYCVLKATVQVRTACMIVSLLTTCLETKLSKHVCQLIMSVQLTFPSLVNCILTTLECQSDDHGSCTSTMALTQCLFSPSSSCILGLLQVLRQFPSWRQSSQSTKFPIPCCY